MLRRTSHGALGLLKRLDVNSFPGTASLASIVSFGVRVTNMSPIKGANLTLALLAELPECALR